MLCDSLDGVLSQRQNYIVRSVWPGVGGITVKGELGRYFGGDKILILMVVKSHI